MARKTSEELNALKKKHRVNDIYSWSRYNTYVNSTYEYLLKYVLRIREDRKDGIYSQSGGSVHDILERFYLKEISYEQMIDEYDTALLQFNLSELKYDRCNDNKNAKIADKYEACIQHFFRNHIPVTKKAELERFITIWVNKFLFQGYIDFMHVEDGYYIITDFKTSTIYTGKKIDKEKGQLVLYAEGIRQLGVPIEKIKIRWAFVKYVTVVIQQANGKSAERNILRSEIGESLTSNIKMWLNKSNQYTENEVDSYLNLVVQTNSIDCLPEDIKQKYIIKDCYVEIPINQEVIDELKQKVNDTLIEIHKKVLLYNQNKDDKVFWEEVTQEQSYYFANLCGYSGFLHKPYGEYLDKFNAQQENSGSGDDKEEDDLDDFSWLNEL